jgi:Plavaka transposase
MDFPDGKSRTIVPIILTSDKTLYSGSGKATGWPLYISIGNISDFVRFVPGQHCAQLLALLPVIKGLLSAYIGP